MMKRLIALSATLLLAVISHAQMVLSGDATGDCDCYTITTTGGQAGSIWSPTTIDLTNSFDFTFNISLGASDGGADGMVFVLRSSGTETGGLGSQLGYQGITESIGVEVDTWNSDGAIAPGDIPQDHVGMSFDGGVDHALVPAIPIDNIEDGAFHLFRVSWDPATMEFTVNLDGTELFVYTEDLVATYFGGVPDVFFGWTGSTGGASNVQEVCMYRTADFTFEPEEPCPGQEIIFTNNATGDLIYNGDTLTSYFWEYGGGDTSDEFEPTYTYGSQGTKTISLTVTDISGCTTTESITFDVRDLEPEIITSDDVSCFGSTDGSATVTVEPLEDTYTYEWDDPLDQTTEEATDLPPGTYTVTVMNEEGCSGSTEVTIGEPAPLAFGDLIISNSSCDAEDGSVLLSGEGGTPGYQYSLGGSAFSADNFFEPLGGGEYPIAIQDANGCLFEDVVTIDASGLDLDYIFNPPSCFGFSDGSLTLTIEGAGDGITFEIRDGDGDLLNEDNSNTANALTSGWYYFYVEDEVGCFQEDSVFIEEPEQLAANYTTIDVRCNGDASGWAKVDTVLNWQGEYDQIAYFWEPNPTGMEGIGVDSMYNMTAGEYVLTINDDNGCTRVYTFEITEPEPLVFSEFGTIPSQCRVFDYQSGNGVVFVAASGGVSDYNYLWRNLTTEATTTNSTWGGLNPACYEITVTDENFCTLIDTICVDSLSPIADFDVISDDLNADLQGTAPVEVTFVNQSLYFSDTLNPFSDTTFFWSLDTLTTGYTLTNNYNETFDTTYDSRGFSYTSEVCLVTINANGCEDILCKTLTIYEDDTFTSVNVFSPNQDGINDLFTFEFKSAAIANFQCVIINRWGVIVNEMNAITDAWDGTDRNGDPCPAGTYFYSYEAVSDNAAQISGQGTVQLVRLEE